MTPVSKDEAVDGTFGGGAVSCSSFFTFGISSARQYGRASSNAYMLVYVRDSVINEVLRPVTMDDVPAHLVTR